MATASATRRCAIACIAGSAIIVLVGSSTRIVIPVTRLDSNFCQISWRTFVTSGDLIEASVSTRRNAASRSLARVVDVRQRDPVLLERPIVDHAWCDDGIRRVHDARHDRLARNGLCQRAPRIERRQIGKRRGRPCLSQRVPPWNPVLCEHDGSLRTQQWTDAVGECGEAARLERGEHDVLDAQVRRPVAGAHILRGCCSSPARMVSPRLRIAAR